MVAVILCNGRKPPGDLILAELERSQLFIAADGGANHARELGLRPDIITGDLDSYRPADEGWGAVEILHNPDQETNDLEKALEVALQRNITRVTIFGAAGRRVDQTLKNLSVLCRFHPRFESIRFLDRYGESFLLPRDITMQVKTGTIISLIPLSGRVEGITTDGLAFPLRDESLEIGVRDGTSNRAVRNQIRIRHREGLLLLIMKTDGAED